MLGSSFVHSPIPDFKNYYSFTHTGLNPVTGFTKGNMICQIRPNRPQKGPASTFVGPERDFSESIQWHMPQPKMLDTEKHNEDDVTKPIQCIPKALPLEKSGITFSSPLKCTTPCQNSAGNNQPLNLSLNANVDTKLSCLPNEVDNDTDSEPVVGVDNYSPSKYDQFNTKKLQAKE